ncbi:MAG: hypothetical protein HYX92_02240 [Chloroflexi bacterium]|nr:hypothetical protein [Chloroflexota bacterium]
MSSGSILGRFMRRPWSVFLLAVLVALLGVALVASRPGGLFGAASSQAITIMDLKPADGSKVPANQEVELSAFIASDSSAIDVKGGVKVSVDGSPIEVQLRVGSGVLRVGFSETRAFAPGSHTLSVEARNLGGQTARAQAVFKAD